MAFSILIMRTRCNKCVIETLLEFLEYCACQHYRSRDDTDAQRLDSLRSGRYITSRPSVINIFHAKHASGGSQPIKVKVLTPLGVFVWLFELLTLFVFCSLGLGIPITSLFSCDGEWINTRPENNPLSMEDINHLLSFHEDPGTQKG